MKSLKIQRKNTSSSVFLKIQQKWIQERQTDAVAFSDRRILFHQIRFVDALRDLARPSGVDSVLHFAGAGCERAYIDRSAINRRNVRYF